MSKIINLKTDGLNLSLEILSHKPGQEFADWLNCGLRAELPAFSANYSFELATHELVTFHKDLLHMQARIGTETAATLQDLAIELILKSNKLGQIHGEFIFNDLLGRFVTDSDASLTGIFRADQTILLPLIQQIQDIFDFFNIDFTQ